MSDFDDQETRPPELILDLTEEDAEWLMLIEKVKKHGQKIAQLEIDFEELKQNLARALRKQP